MALVAIAAFWLALFPVCFAAYGRREIPLMPVIVVNYFTATAWGVAVAPPWSMPLPPALLGASVGLGTLYVTVFYITGLSSQRAGVAATSVAGKMSLVLTVLAAVALFGDRPTALGWLGIALALIAVPTAASAPGPPGARGQWLLPVLLFFGNAVIDITINAVQRALLDARTEALFPTLVFAVAGSIGLAAMAAKGRLRALLSPRALIAGALLGSINYASLHFVVASLARSGMPPSTVFPLLNIGVILFSTAIGIAALGDRPRRVQWIGIGLGVAAMALILLA